MRNHILQNCSNNYEMSVINAKLSDLDRIDAMFICNSVMGVMPVRTFEKQKLSLIPCHEIAELIKDVM